MSRPGRPPAPAFEQTFLKLLPAKPEKTFEAAGGRRRKSGDASQEPRTGSAQPCRSFLEDIRDDKATLRKPGDDPDKNKDTLDEVFQQTLAAVHDQLKGQLDQLFDEAQNGPKSLSHPATVCGTFSASPSLTVVQHGGALLPNRPRTRASMRAGLRPVLGVVGLTVHRARSTTQAALCKPLARSCKAAPLGTRRIPGGASGADRRVARSGGGAPRSLRPAGKEAAQLADEEEIVKRRKTT